VEFDRFANAYLRFVGAAANIGPGQAKPNGLQRLLRSIRELRVFQNLRSPDDVTFLTKDIPKDFVDFMTELIRNEIHKQSHVPDFMSERFGSDLSGVAIARLMFDFENLVADAEADFDEGLRQRIQLMADVIEVTSSVTIEPYDMQISHKRNIPLNIKEAAETARALRDAGFSMQFVVETMPDDLIADVDTELDRQRDERTMMFEDTGGFDDSGAEQVVEQPVTEDIQQTALNGAQIKSLLEILTSVGTGTISVQTAKAAIAAAFPSISDTLVDQMIAGIEVRNTPQPNSNPNSTIKE
jgi:hypothetical protein